MIVQVTNNIQVNTASNSYSNCHQFTRDVIVAISNTYREVMCPILTQYLNTAFPTALDTATLGGAYLNMIQRGEASLFNLADYHHVPDASLIIFVNVQGVAHSMIKIQNDTWIGANNLGSLSNVGANTYPIPLANTHPADVREYPNMTNRNYTHNTSGGWGPDNIMRSHHDDQYTMYFMQLV